MSHHEDMMWQPFPTGVGPEGDDLLDLELRFDDPLGDDDLISATRLAALVQDEECDG